MRAERFCADSKTIAVEDIPVPEPGPGEVLVKVAFCGICHSDLSLINGIFPAQQPVVTQGHEASGTIAGLGAGVTGWAEGDRVIVAAGRPCMTCPNCRRGDMTNCLRVQLMAFAYDGAWAEYTVAQAVGLTRVPDNVPLEQAAILADAVSTPFGAVVRTGQVGIGESVGVWGVGGVGTHIVQLARLVGAVPVIAIDIKPAVLDRALELGADHALDAGDPGLRDKLEEITGGRMLDVAFDAVGLKSTFEQALDCITVGGRLVGVGMSAESPSVGPTRYVRTHAEARPGPPRLPERRHRNPRQVVVQWAAGSVSLDQRHRFPRRCQGRHREAGTAGRQPDPDPGQAVTDDLKGNVAVLTGASGGIGKAIARRLADEGADLCLAYGRHADDAESVAEYARELGRRVTTVAADMSDPHAPAALVAHANNELGQVDMLIANAGTADVKGWQEIDLASWNTTLAVNLTAPFLLAQQVLPGMIERTFGRILFISSVAAITGGVVGAHYAASKAGLHGLMHYLAPRIAAEGVTINCLAPALVGATKMFPADLETGTPPIPIPVGRVGRPDEMADMAIAMLRNGYLTNKVITLDGGIVPRN